MGATIDRVVAVTGVTGNQGGPAARSLLRRGFRVRGLTRNASSSAAQRLADGGVELIQGDMSDGGAVGRLMSGASAAVVVTDFFQNGLVREVAQGRLIAESAKNAAVRHVVFASIGFVDQKTGVPCFEAKREIEERMAEIDLPVTILRPSLFMEDLAEMRSPAAVWWGSMRRVAGWDKPLPWISVRDLGEIAALVVARPDEYIGRTLRLTGDVRSLRESQEIFLQVDGKRPLAIPIPLFLVRRLVDEDLIPMWQWIGENSFEPDRATAKKIFPGVENMESWLRRFRSEA